MKLSCKNVSFIVSESLNHKLSWRERLKLKIHLMMCKACQRMVQQMQMLRAVSRRYGSVGGNEPRRKDETLSKEASARILARLRQAEHDYTDHE